jgi:proteasome alpha subunit
VFTQESKPYEVEIVVAEVGQSAEQDQIYRLTYDGSVADEQGFIAMGGAGEQITAGLQERWTPGMSLGNALGLAVDLLRQDPAGGPERTLTPTQLEVAVLDRARPRRTFRRLVGPLLDALLSSEDSTMDLPADDDPAPGRHDTLTGKRKPPQRPKPDPS